MASQTASRPRATTRRTAPSFPPAIPDRRFLHIPANVFTHDGFREWVKANDFPEKLRVTFLDQEIYLDMSEEELETHAVVKAETCRVLMNLNHERKLGKFYLDGVLITNAAAGVSNNPDATFVRRDSIRAGRVRLVPRKGQKGQYLEIEGIPDWVMELVSDSSVEKDTEKLLQAYHRARIPEYWLIDARGEEMIFRILLWRKSGYVAAPVKDGWQHSRVFDRRFRLERQREEFGLWEYTLHVS